MNRREFTKTGINAGLGLSFLPHTLSFGRDNISILDSITEKERRDFLSGLLYTRQEVDDYFADRAFPFSKHSPEFGWLLRDAYFQDGVNDSISVYHFAKPDGERIMSNYADMPCRINTYGMGPSPLRGLNFEFIKNGPDTPIKTIDHLAYSNPGIACTINRYGFYFIGG